MTCLLILARVHEILFRALILSLYTMCVLGSVTILSPLFLRGILVLTAFSVGRLLGLHVIWFFYVLVLIFLGGIIVLILYLSALRDNEKFFIPNARRRLKLGAVLFSNIVIGVVLCSSDSLATLDLTIFLLGPECGLWGVILRYLLIVLFLCVKVTQRHKGAINKF